MIHLILGCLIVIGGVANWYVGAREQDAALRKQGQLKFIVYVALIAVHLGLMEWSQTAYVIFSIFLMLMGLYELTKIVNRRQLSTKLGLLVIAIFVAIALKYLWFVHAEMLTTLKANFIIVVTFDAFSQLGGKLVGKTKVGKVSPNKTWEGFIVGTLFAMMVAFLVLREANPNWSIAHVIVQGLLISVVAFLGDLLASKFKRTAGVKDFSNLLPGQGGVLDRYDGLFSTGLVWW